MTQMTADVRYICGSWSSCFERVSGRWYHRGKCQFSRGKCL